MISMNDEQRVFLKKLAERIPRLFEVIKQGNIKSEYIVGIRRIGERHVRLKLVAEVVDPGANPLASHGTMLSVNVSTNAQMPTNVPIKSVGVSGSGGRLDSSTETASKRRRPRKR